MAELERIGFALILVILAALAVFFVSGAIRFGHDVYWDIRCSSITHDDRFKKVRDPGARREGGIIEHYYFETKDRYPQCGDDSR